MPRESLAKDSTSPNRRSSNYTGRRSCVLNQDEIAARFRQKVRRTDGCWLWDGVRNTATGYGLFSSGTGPQVYAHRFAYALSHGSIPAGQFVLHACDTPLCVNPAHLFLGTHRDNMRDAAKKGRLHVSRPSGQKVTDAQVAHIHTLAASGLARVRIADQIGVSKAYVSLVLSGKRRQHRKAS